MLGPSATLRQVLEQQAGQEIKKLSDRLTRVKDTRWDQALNACGTNGGGGSLTNAPCSSTTVWLRIA